MQEKNAVIALFDEQGKQRGTKYRNEIDQHKDILKVVNIIVLNNKGELLMTKPKNNIFSTAIWASSAAGLVRDKEATLNAAIRTVKRELGLSLHLLSLGEKYYDFDGIKRIMASYYGTTSIPIHPNREDVESFEWMTPDKVERIIDACLPTFTATYALLKEAQKAKEAEKKRR